MVGKAKGGHTCGIVEVPAVEDDGVLQEASHHVEIGRSELVPLGDDRQCIGLFQGTVGTVAVGEPILVNSDKRTLAIASGS